MPGQLADVIASIMGRGGKGVPKPSQAAIGRRRQPTHQSDKALAPQFMNH
jgi:hypothetical protein